VSATCDDGLAALRVVDPTTGKSVERRVALAQAAPTALARPFVELAAVADTHLLASGDWLFGGGAGAAFWISPKLLLRLDALADYGELSRASGTVVVTMPSLSAAFGASFTRGVLRPVVTLGVRAGYVWMNGVAASTGNIGSGERGAWFGPEAAFELGVWPRARIHPVLALRAGTHIVGVRGTVSEGRDVEDTAIWGGLSLGLAVR
jgi:hypothetical protein